MPLSIAAILPHMLLFGGVKRYVELGRTFIDRGHSYTIYTPDGKGPEWCEFCGQVKPLAELAAACHDAVITSEEVFLDNLTRCNARIRIFYVINQNKALRTIARLKDVIFFVNSSRSHKRVKQILGINGFRAPGGVNTQEYFPRTSIPPEPPFVVMTYGRQSMKLKGTHIVKAACERLYKKGYPIQLLLFDTLTGIDSEQNYKNFTAKCPFEFVVQHPAHKNRELYAKAHVFATAERKGAWANTAAEAMACGVPVVATSVGSTDFLIDGKTGLQVGLSVGSVARAIVRLYQSPELREKVSTAGASMMTRFQWRITADMILSLLERSDIQRVWHDSWPYSVQQISVERTRKVKHPAANDTSLMPGVYIINYHSIVDKTNAGEWESAHASASTGLDKFKSHVAWLLGQATNIPLHDVPDMLKNGTPDKAYFALTFDSSFGNVKTSALPILKEFGITATAFINSAFANGSVSPDVQLSRIIAEGQYRDLAAAVKKNTGMSIPYTRSLLRIKQSTEQYTEVIKQIHKIGESLPAIQPHLSWDDIRFLQEQGWSIGNNTASHACLSSLSHDRQISEIEEVIQECKNNAIALIPWLAYPYGSSEHVNGSTLTWMQEHADWFGVFASGGVNTKLYRTEMLSIPVSNSDLKSFKNSLWDSIRRTQPLLKP